MLCYPPPPPNFYSQVIHNKFTFVRFVLAFLLLSLIVSAAFLFSGCSTPNSDIEPKTEQGSNPNQPSTEDETLIKNYYSVYWQDYDGNVLECDENVPEGTVAEFNGIEPTRQGNEQYSYIFNGWDKPIAPVKDFAYYTATYSETLNTYTVEWRGVFGVLLEKDENVPYGSVPEYNGNTPGKQGYGGAGTLQNQLNQLEQQYKNARKPYENAITVLETQWENQIAYLEVYNLFFDLYYELQDNIANYENLRLEMIADLYNSYGIEPPTGAAL
ncbi:hypothetical protein FACS1894211_12690 [Clostridia bacterium]|nr:hypothetical protein FACS1894211_12690 [Clostridia bacterium]